MFQATLTFDWMAALSQRSAQSCWSSSLPVALPTSSFCSPHEQVVWDSTFRLPTLSSYLIRTGTLTRYVGRGWEGELGGVFILELLYGNDRKTWHGINTTCPFCVCPTCIGHPSSGQSPPHWPDERGPSAATLHRKQRGGEDPRCSEVQVERRREGDPGRDVRPEVNGQ